jgi:hypothetical protein
MEVFMYKLNKNNYNQVIDEINGTPINILFVLSVLKEHGNGIVYVDNPKSPETFYIVTSYGMTFLFGNTNNDSFNEDLFKYFLNKESIREKTEWMQVYPSKWEEIIESKIKNVEFKIIKNTRTNFKFDSDLYNKHDYLNLDNGLVIKQIDESIYKSIKLDVNPKYYWTDFDKFISNGMGFCIMDKSEIVSMTFSAYKHENKLEIGVESSKKYQGKGYALKICSKLIDYCLENNLEPVWSCRKENAASFNLAKKLGFKPVRDIPYYQII